MLLLLSFILRSSVKLNYFLRELGLDGEGPHNSVLEFEGGKKEIYCNMARFLEEETFNTHSS